MALIGKIREKSGLVLTLIAVAVIGFVVMDMTQGGPSGNSSIFDNPNVKGVVNGSKINTSDFERAQRILYDRGDRLSTTTQLWNFFVEKALVDKEAKCLGLGVSKEELLDLQFSADPSKLSPIIQQRFVDRSSGQINVELLQQYKAAIESGDLLKKNPQIYEYWGEQEKEIVKERVQAKFNAMVSKGAYAPSWMAEMLFNDQNTKADVLAVKVPFAAVGDNEIQVSDDDYKAYIQDNKGIFFRNREAKKIAYGVFNVVATAADSQAVAKKVAALIPNFKAASNDSTFVLSNDGANDGTYMKKDQMSKQAADSLFSRPIGAVVGPYLDGTTYRVAKILGRRVVADSVKARHVLFQGLPKKTTDSLFTALKDGKISWDSLNRKYSTDKVSAAKGGDLGYFAPGMMVKEFNDLCFYKAEQGKYYTVNTQFGTHIIQVTGVKNIKNEQAVRVAYIQAAMEPSEDTQNKVKDKALAIIQQNKTLEALKAALEKEGINLETSAPVEPNDYQLGSLGGNEKTRQIVRWANEAKVGQVSTELYDFSNEGQYYTNKYVVTALKAIVPAGLPAVADVKDEIEGNVKNRKKGEVIKSKLAGKDLNGALSTFSLPGMKIDTIRQVAFASQFTPGLGNEPKVVGAIFNTAQGGTTAPVVGTSGVIIAQVQSIVAATLPADLKATKMQITNTYRNQLRSRLMPTMKDKADIKDYRSKQGF